MTSVTYNPYWGSKIFFALDALDIFLKRVRETSHVDFWLGDLRHHEPTATRRNIQRDDENVNFT